MSQTVDNGPLPDDPVEQNLFLRATGYTKEVIKVHELPNGQKIRVTTRMTMPSDTSAERFWLRYRRWKRWGAEPAVSGDMHVHLIEADFLGTGTPQNVIEAMRHGATLVNGELIPSARPQASP